MRRIFLSVAAAAIMVPLILVFYSLADAQARIVNIPCGKDIDATINADPRSTASRFVLGADCPFTASATIVPSNGDEVACAVAPTFDPLSAPAYHVEHGPAYDPTTRCTVAGAASVANVFRPIGQGGTTATVRFEGIKITGGNFTGSSGTGTAIAEGSMTNDSYHYGIEVRDNDAAGILSAKGTFDSVEFTNNTRDPNALGFIGAAMKARTEVEVKNSYIHHTQGNGLWCDEGCVDSTSHPNGFWVHHNLVVDNGRAGIRFENVGGTNAGEALIENNEVHGNSPDAVRGGISVRDAQNATIQNNRFGDPPNSNNVAIMASDSGSAGRPDLFNIDIINNILNGETIKGCESPDEIVACSNNEQTLPRTDATAPTVMSTVPAANAIGVARTTNVTATFSEDMDALSLNGRTFKLFKKGSTTKLSATVSYDAVTDTAILDPRDPLLSGVTYKAVVTTGAMDPAGNPLAQQHRWFFTVG
jgi:Big-like domain-containing protein